MGKFCSCSILAPFSLLCFFVFGSLSFPLFPQVVPSGRFAPATQPRGWGGEGDSPVTSAPDRSLVPLHSGVSRSGDRWPSRQVLPEEKRHSPERVARKPRKGPAGSSLSGWPQAPSGVPAVLFPFSREDLHRFPLRVQAVSPYRRKTPRPMGS